MSKGSILMVISSFQQSGGHSSVISSYCSGLRKIGYNTAIGAFSFDKKPPDDIQMINLKKFRNLTSNSEDNFDLIISHQTHINYYSLITPKPFVFHYHGTSNKIQEINLRLSSFLYKNKISTIIPTSQSSLNHLRKVTGGTATSEVIRNGVDTTYYNTSLPKPYSRGDPQLLFVGNLYPHKNATRLIQAMPNIIKTYPNAHLQIIGNGDDYQRINHLIEGKQLKGEVELLGALHGEELRLRYSSCDIYISASKLEASPLPPLEALACGKPLLLSDIPAHRELIEVSNAGRVFSLIDDSSILHMIREIHDNMRFLCLEARKFAEKQDWDVVCSRLARIYDQVLTQN